MIKLVYGHLADYACEGSQGKIIIVGIFDRVFTRSTGPFRLPSSYLAMKFEASLLDGSDNHLVEVKLVDGNSQPALPHHPRIPLRFGTVGPGYPLSAQVILQLENLTIPDVGDWAFEIRIDGTIVGSIPLIAAQAAAP